MSKVSTTKDVITENKLKTYEWFYSQLQSLIKSTNLALNSKGNSVTYLGHVKLEQVPNTNKKIKKGNRLSNSNLLKS